MNHREPEYVPEGWLKDHEIPPEGSPLQALGSRLADLLDDDKWNNVEPLLFAVARQLAAPPPSSPAPSCLTGLQIEYLHDMIGGELDSEIGIGYRIASHDNVNDLPMPAGLYAWFAEYPEEGAVYLPETAADVAAGGG